MNKFLVCVAAVVLACVGSAAFAATSVDLSGEAAVTATAYEGGVTVVATFPGGAVLSWHAATEDLPFISAIMRPVKRRSVSTNPVFAQSYAMVHGLVQDCNRNGLADKPEFVDVKVVRTVAMVVTPPDPSHPHTLGSGSGDGYLPPRLILYYMDEYEHSYAAPGDLVRTADGRLEIDWTLPVCYVVK